MADTSAAEANTSSILGSAGTVAYMSNLATRKSSVSPDENSLFVVNPGQTFLYDDNLPSLPVPPLEHTLNLYLESVRPHVSDEDFLCTEQIVQQFENGIGKQLHEKLLKKSSQEKNWLEKWWEDEVYLKLRYPLIPLLNMSGNVPMEDHLSPNYEQRFTMAGLALYYTGKFWKLLRRQQLRPFINRNVPWSMNQFLRLFNTTRIPGLEKDSLSTYFTTDLNKPVPRHLVVLCQGHIFAFDLLHPNEDLLNPHEITSQLRYIYDWCHNLPDGPGIGALTVADRTSWAQNRKLLCELHPDNSNHLQTIDSALLVLALDDKDPQNDSEMLFETMGGDCSNRWADKSVSNISFKNGCLGGNADHAPFDGLVTGSLSYYVNMGIKEEGHMWTMEPQKIGNLPNPKKLEFCIDDNIENAIAEAKQTFYGLCADLDCIYEHYNGYGKEFLKPFSLRPEGFLQMAIQAAYYRMYKRPAPTYVTASTRQFYHGRTETCRSCFPEAVDWARAMAEDKLPTLDKAKLLHLAIQKFSSLLNECTHGQGCDRHLFGLYMVAQEEGIDIPELFTDPSYTKSGGGGNFILSTSCSGYSSGTGGVPPMCEQGYGTFYSIENHRLNFVITSYKHCAETDSRTYFKHLVQTLDDMQQLVLSAKL